LKKLFERFGQICQNDFWPFKLLSQILNDVWLGRNWYNIVDSFQGIHYNVCTCSHWLNNIKVALVSKIAIYQNSFDFDKQLYVQALRKMSIQCKGDGEL
jgi:hypothetical protein